MNKHMAKFLSLIICAISISASALLSSCTKDDSVPNYSNQDFLKMAREGDPDLKVLIPSGISEALVHCSEYTPECRYGLKVIVKQLQLKALFYDSQTDALEAAKRVKGYVSRNWVLDDAVGEPILERFVEKSLKGKKALEIKTKLLP